MQSEVFVGVGHLWQRRVIFELNVAFGQQLVVLHTIPSMFNSFATHAWK